MKIHIQKDELVNQLFYNQYHQTFIRNRYGKGHQTFD